MTLKPIVGEEVYEKTRRALVAAFPDPKVIVTDAHVDIALQLGHAAGAPELAGLAIPAPPPVVVPKLAVPADPRFTYYLAKARHTRQGPPGSDFLGELPVVRMTLPNTGDQTNIPVVHSPAGDLLVQDRFFGSVDVLWGSYKSDPIVKARGIQRPERVDFIGAPRLKGARFAAISLYFCYAKKTDPTPTFYVLEAGLATGQPRQRYIGYSMNETILEQTNYHPTTFSDDSHFYEAKLTTHANGDPDVLAVKVYTKKPPNGNYINVTVQYVRQDEPVMTNPFHITIGAGARVQAIADALHVDSELDLQPVLRAIAHFAHLFDTPPKPV